MSHDLGALGRFGEEGQANLPSRGIGAKLVQIIKGLCLQGLVGGRVPGDLNGICYLQENNMSMRHVGFRWYLGGGGVMTRSSGGGAQGIFFRKRKEPRGLG